MNILLGKILGYLYHLSNLQLTLWYHAAIIVTIHHLYCIVAPQWIQWLQEKQYQILFFLKNGCLPGIPHWSMSQHLFLWWIELSHYKRMHSFLLPTLYVESRFSSFYSYFKGRCILTCDFNYFSKKIFKTLVVEYGWYQHWKPPVLHSK